MASPAGSRGGRSEVTLTNNEMPRHNHGGETGNVSFLTRTGEGKFSGGSYTLGSVNKKADIAWDGGGNSFNILPPYISATFCVKYQ